MGKRVNKGRMPIVPGQHPAVVFADDIVQERNLSASRVSRQAGVGESTISNWRTKGNSPSVGNLEAVLNVLGFRLAVVPLGAAE